MRPIILHPDVDAEITETARYYESRVPGLGSDMLDELEKALDQISANPEAWQRIGRKVRKKSLWRFPYNLIYEAYHERILIVAFAHQKRRPFYWRKRLKNTID